MIPSGCIAMNVPSRRLLDSNLYSINYIYALRHCLQCVQVAIADELAVDGVDATNLVYSCNSLDSINLFS